MDVLRSVFPVTGDRVCASRAIGHPRQALSLDDEQLVLLDESAPPALRVIDVARARVTQKAGSRGRKPGGFLGPRSLTRREDDPGAVWAFDSVLRRLTRFEVPTSEPRGIGTEQGAAAPDVHRKEMITLSGSYPVQQAEWSGDQVIATGAFPGGRVGRFDGRGNLLEQFGEIPGPAGEDALVRQQAYESVLRVHPRGELMVLATRWADRLEVLDQEGTVLATAPRLRGFDPEYRVDHTFGRPTALFGKDSRAGYLDIVVDQDRILALFGGRRARECGVAARAGRLVLEFGWDLYLRSAFELDHDAVAISLSARRDVLYTAIRHPGPGLMRYTLHDGHGADIIRFPPARVV